MMRDLTKTDKVPDEEGTMVPKVAKIPTPREAQLMELAQKMGYALTPVTNLRRQLAKAIANRMVNRSGDTVYQSAAFTLTNFPLSALEMVLPPHLLTNDEPGAKTWSMPSVEMVASVLGPLLQENSMCAGASRALKTASERWSRVLATICGRHACDCFGDCAESTM